MSRERTEPRWWQRLVQKLASTRVGTWVLSRTAHRIDRVLMELSDGRVSTSKVLAGLPTVRLTTTGAKTGKERTVPVMGMRDGEEWVLVASNWGGDGHPAWYHNLRADPEVELTYNGRTNRYVAREATGETRAEYWERAKELYLGFEPYQRQAGEREIPIVVLTPRAE